MDVSLGLDLVVVWEAVHFVDKHLEVDLWIDSVCSWNSEMKPAQGLHVIILWERNIPIQNAICTSFQKVIILTFNCTTNKT